MIVALLVVLLTDGVDSVGLMLSDSVNILFVVLVLLFASVHVMLSA